MGDEFDFDNLFTYHAPKGDQVERYQRIRDAARQFAETVAENCPSGLERSESVWKIREAMMMANAAIACGEAYSED